jgi:ankyrin repeat protein
MLTLFASEHSSAELLQAIADGGNVNAVVSRELADKLRDSSKYSVSIGQTPLMLVRDSAVLLDALLDKGAEVNAADAEGKTPLNYAIRGGYLEIADKLLDKGADPNKADKDNETPLMAAILGCRADLVELLASRGADKTLKNKDGKTALDILHECISGFKADEITRLETLLGS